MVGVVANGHRQGATKIPKRTGRIKSLRPYLKSSTFRSDIGIGAVVDIIR
jgi:hypothetical protein